MVQIITKRDYDPKEEFTGIWINTVSGSIFIWSDRPIVIGHTKGGRMIRADVFEQTFEHEQNRRKQKYVYEYPYLGLPVAVVARIEQDHFHGEPLQIYFGDLYGEVSGSGDWLVSQSGNVKIGENIKIKCVPTEGVLRSKVIVLTYE